MTFALGGVGGPLIGGLLTQADLFGLAWWPIFLINLPIGVLAMVAGLALLRDSRVPQAPRLDPGGIGLATLALLLSSEKIAGLGWYGTATVIRYGKCNCRRLVLVLT